jgi:periplasmic divalent cation tolerance protein
MIQSCILYVTWPDAESAAACARSLIAAKAAACVTLVPGAHSFYEWGGALEEAVETVMLVKTTAGAAPKARDLIVAAHPYDVPCVLDLPAAGQAGHAPYLAWLEQQTS